MTSVFELSSLHYGTVEGLALSSFWWEAGVRALSLSLYHNNEEQLNTTQRQT